MPASQLSLSNLVYVGTWNATTNTPALADGTGTQGNYYVVSAVGATSLDGITDWQVGDWAVFNGTVWEKADHSDAVTSVAGKQGAIALDTDDVAEGSNLYYTEARVDANTNVSSNTTHRGRTDNPHSVTKTQIGLADVENLKVKLDATVAPTITDDVAAGYSAGSVWVDVTADRAYVLLDSAVAAAVWKETTASGEANTASNVGVGGVGVFKQKNGTDLELRTLDSGSSKVTVTLDAGNNEIDVDVAEGNIVHQNLSGAGTNTHAQIDTHVASSANPHSVTKAQIGLSNVQDLKASLAATVAPTVTDDSAAGYSVGSRWFDVTNDRAYVLLDASATAAVWKETTAAGSVGLTDTQTLTNKTLEDSTTFFADNADNTKLMQLELSGIATATTRTLTIPDVSTTLVGTDATQTLVNKLLDADLNTVSNIDNAAIKAAAAIDASKIADGSVSNAEFQLLNGLTSSAVGVSDTQTLTNKTLGSAETVTIDYALLLTPSATAPGTPVLGTLYVNTSGALCFYDGVAWAVAAGAGAC